MTYFIVIYTTESAISPRYACNMTYTKGEDSASEKVTFKVKTEAGVRAWRSVLGRSTGICKGQGDWSTVIGQDIGKNKAGEAGRDQIMQIWAFTIRATDDKLRGH